MSVGESEKTGRSPGRVGDRKSAMIAVIRNGAIKSSREL